MSDWQIVYLVAQVITFVALARIGAQAFELLLDSRGQDAHRNARILLWVFLAFAVVFLAKDIFWTLAILGRQILPSPLADPLALAIVLTFIQVGASAVFTWLWHRLTHGD